MIYFILETSFPTKSLYQEFLTFLQIHQLQFSFRKDSEF